ncbi:MAG: ABC transporter substrate-binding protein [Lachnospiraceae bacterium]|nr:ABC transporter substrate-binding protein [Lachnospiraceae bacterium]
MKKFYALLLTAVMVLSLTACGNNETQEQPAAEEPAVEEPAAEEPAVVEEEPAVEEEVETVQLNVAYMPNYASLWSVLTAMDQGYFAEENLEITLWEFADGPSEIAAMEGGSIDLAYIGHGAHRLCIQGQATIFAPSSVHSTDKIIVLPSAEISSADDLPNLAGKKVAYNGGSSSETALNGALAVAGLTMDDIEGYEMDATNMVAAMISGNVDACTAWNPYSVQILENCEGAEEIEFATDSVNLSSWICLPSYAEENRDILVRFSRALYKAMEYSSNPDNWDYAVGLYATQCAKDKESCLVETGDATWFSAEDVKNGIADNTMQNYYQRQQEMFIEGGQVEEEAPLENYVLFDVMEEALGN